MLNPREDFVGWDDYFMAMAILASSRSKDPHTQVGASLVNDENKIISLGYNGFPRGVGSKTLPWERDGDWINTKYPYVVHAEQNAIHNSVIHNLTDCRLYCTLFPCSECAKIIIQRGIKEVIYLSDKYHNEDFCIAARRMFDLVDIKYRQYIGKTLYDVNLKTGICNVQ